jgi:hypothetical protein
MIKSTSSRTSNKVYLPMNIEQPSATKDSVNQKKANSCKSEASKSVSLSF